MYRILLLVIALIVYGSLYPWDFHPAQLAASPLWILLHSWPTTRVVHRLTENFAQQNHVSIVDPNVHKVQDPEDGIRNGQSAESAVESGFNSGLLTLSEIIFDLDHKRAALQFSFRCGGLCGHTETVVYEKRRGVWERSKNSCGFGIS